MFDANDRVLSTPNKSERVVHSNEQPDDAIHEPPAPATAPPPPGVPLVVVRVELRCLLCARELGTLVAARWVTYGPILFWRTGEKLGTVVSDWRRLRCSSCGGNVYPDSVRDVRLYPRIVWQDDPPRRGRPPK